MVGDRDTRPELYQTYNQGMFKDNTELLRSIDNRLQRLENSIMGNGREGLASIQAKQDVRLTAVEAAIVELSKAQTGIRAHLGRISLGLGIAIYALTGTFF